MTAGRAGRLLTVRTLPYHASISTLVGSLKALRLRIIVQTASTYHPSVSLAGHALRSSTKLCCSVRSQRFSSAFFVEPKILLGAEQKQQVTSFFRTIFLSLCLGWPEDNHGVAPKDIWHWAESKHHTYHTTHSWRCYCAVLSYVAPATTSSYPSLPQDSQSFCSFLFKRRRKGSGMGEDNWQ